MARHIPSHDASKVLEAAQVWIQRCLIEERSILSDEPLWMIDHFEDLKAVFTANPDEGGDSFVEKLRRQMSHAQPASIRLMAELLWVLFLFIYFSNMLQATKRDAIAEVWSWSGEDLGSDNPMLADDALQGIANPGTAYSTHRWREINYLIDLCLDLLRRGRTERQEILRDRDRFEAWLRAAPQDGDRPFRHIFRYLAFPDHNERIVNNRHRRAILLAYAQVAETDLASMSESSMDDALRDLRERLKSERKIGDFDYYEEPFATEWNRRDGQAVRKNPGQTRFTAGFMRLRAGFLQVYPGFSSFVSDDRYIFDERAYKDELVELFRDMVLAPLGAEDWIAAGEGFLALLTRPLANNSNKPQNIVGWRYIERVRQLGSEGRSVFAQLLASLLDETIPIEDRVDSFVKDWLATARPNEQPKAPAQRSIVGFCLALAYPSRYIFLKSREIGRALKELDPTFAWSLPRLTGADVTTVVALVGDLMSHLEALGWAPKDRLDAQGFMWVSAVALSVSRVAEKGGDDDEEGEGEMMTISSDFVPRPALNRILYGPPGTGKTYQAINAALEVLDPVWLRQHSADATLVRSSLKARFDDLVKEGVIRFVTFHQSFSYEDFVEGLRADTDETGAIQYRVESGVFKQICEAAGGAALMASKVGVRDGARIWKISIDGTGSSATREHGFRHGQARIGWGDVGDLTDEHLTESAEFKSLGSHDRNTLNSFAREIQPGDVMLCIASASEVQAIGVVQGDYSYERQVPAGVISNFNNVLPVRWVATNLSLDLRELNGGLRFTLKTVYELTRFSWAELTEVLAARKIVLDGGVTSNPKPAKDHVLIIDEINRGNVSRIFGELITLIEASKRAGAPEQLEVTLPYSKKRFQVPQNLYLIGTMNTADRSLSGLDIALRRRFSFVEMPPRPDFLRGAIVAGVDLEQLLAAINQRIEVLLDREHAIGHAYFLSLKTGSPLAALADVFRCQVIPLLQEYFFEDWERIAWVLNDHRKREGYRFIVSVPFSADTLFGQQAEIAPDRKLWRIDAVAFERVESYTGIFDISKS